MSVPGHLTLCFQEAPTTNGLADFISLIGGTLSSLELQGPRMELDDSFIIQKCPNLERLSLSGDLVDVQLDVNAYRLFPGLSINWQDVSSLAILLSDVDTPVAKCVRCLHVRLNFLAEAHHDTTFTQLEADLEQFLRVLQVNRHLEVLEVVVQPEYKVYADAFRKHHQQPIPRVQSHLSVDNRAAFLSVMSHQALHPTKKTTPTKPSLPILDQESLANILAFAALPVFRKVNFRSQS